MTATINNNKKKKTCCYKRDWLFSLTKEKDWSGWTCYLCKEIAKDAVELICEEHENNNNNDDDDNVIIIGEICLQEYLKKNNNKCPIGQHENCKYIKNKIIRKYLNEII
ncbi:hypothetical protein RFI_28592, partial [Reticulomyxa filosa]